MSERVQLPSLYSISTEIAALLDDDDDAALLELEAKLPQLEAKAVNVAAWLQYQEDLADVLKRREEAIATARKAMQAKADRARDYLRRCMEQAQAYKIVDNRTGTTISLQKNPPHVVVEDEGQIEEKFWRQPPPPAKVIDKRALLDACKAGHVPGAHIEQGMRLVVK